MFSDPIDDLFASLEMLVQGEIDASGDPGKQADAQLVFDEAVVHAADAQAEWSVNDVAALDSYKAAADKLKTAYEKLL